MDGTGDVALVKDTTFDSHCEGDLATTGASRGT